MTQKYDSCARLEGTNNEASRRAALLYRCLRPSCPDNFILLSILCCHIESALNVSVSIILEHPFDDKVL
jgi:hypothetical protein